MSCDDLDMLGAFTELEIAAGVPDLVFGPREESTGRGFGYELDAYDVLDEKEEEQVRTRENSAAKLSKTSETLDSFKMCVIKLLLEEEIDYIIKRYSKKESLPDIYHGLIRQKECLEILIKGMLGKVAKINITSSLEEEVRNVVATVLKNKGMCTPYQRVGEIQSFIHNKVDEIYGRGSCTNLPKQHMRNLLSAARLYLSIREISGGNALYLNYIMDKCEAEAEEEEKRAEQYCSSDYVYLAAGKHYYPKWRVRHLRHVSYYSRESTRELISNIREVSEAEIGEGLARDKIISLYARNGSRL